MTESESLARLAACYGILPAYFDVEGREHHASDATRRALLTAMGVSANGEAAIRESLRAWTARQWQRVLPPAVVLRDRGQPLQLMLRLPARLFDAVITWRIAAEDGGMQEGQAPARELSLIERVDDESGVFEIRAATLPTLAHGYHRVALLSGVDPIGEAALIVTPSACYCPPALESGRRVWGPTTQLYAVRSRRNWGIGDFTDLRMLVQEFGRRSAGIVGVNPLHALFPDNPNHASPYSPSSRRFLNVQYLDPEAIPDFPQCEEAQRRVASPAFQRRLASLRSLDFVDYAGVAAAKREVLELLFESFEIRHLAPGSERGRAFRAFQKSGGRALRLHALYEALQEYFRSTDPGILGWMQWPEPYRNPAHPAVARFQSDHLERTEFYEYLQWNAALQLEAVARTAAAAGMGVGLYADLAVSVAPEGAEVWSGQDIYALDASVGCPPDPLGPTGQDWGLPPLIPLSLAEAGYLPFIQLLRVNMTYAGALRLDHVMGLRRLFWIPRGGKAADGAYLAYPFEDLLGILALESHRNRCLVIGEDLGTVPDEVRHAMARERILSYKVLIFEREHGGDFKAPQRYEREALVAATTHDLPTLAGFWTGRDLTLRERLGFFSRPGQREAELWNRSEDRHRLLAALGREGLAPAGVDASSATVMPNGLAQAVHAYLARTPCKVHVVQVEDVQGVETPVNIPGTAEEYPNWRRRLPTNLEDMPGSEPFESITATLTEAYRAQETSE
jgi:(1->4)-alpha-D-glucan 1-alpha-D-glucosylmutase